VHRFGGELLVQLQQQQVFNIGLNISWQGFGLSDQLFVMRYPWGKVCYSLFVYLA
jgi:hypothetical protein